MFLGKIKKKKLNASWKKSINLLSRNEEKIPSDLAHRPRCS